MIFSTFDFPQGLACFSKKNDPSIFAGPVDGGVTSGEMNQTIQRYIGSFAQASFGKFFCQLDISPLFKDL